MKSIAMRHALAAAFLLAVSAASAQHAPPQSAHLESTEFLGCSGEPDRDDLKATARRITSHQKVTFLVSSVASCGLEGRDLKTEWKDGQLDLSFALYSPDDSVVMCYCDYWAKYTFDAPAMYLHRVTVNGQAPVLVGEWPNGP